MSQDHQKLRGLVDRHFASGLGPRDEADLRAHLPACPSCRAAYEAYQVAEQLDPAAATPYARLGRALGLAARGDRGPGRRAGRALVWATLASATALLLVALASGRDRHPMARGSSPGGAEALDVAIFRLHDGHGAGRVSHLVSARDELAFAYRNEVGKAFLMIFATDAEGRVLWYHPAWTNPTENPSAVPITKQVGFKELPEAIRHPLAGARLTLHSLFLDQPLDVRTVEARLAAGGLVPDARAGEVLRVTELEVRP